MKIPVIEISQPIGVFYLSTLSADTILKIAAIRRRKDGKGIQREASQKRIKEIASYCSSPDAAFPTPIIIALDDIPDTIIGTTFIEFNERNTIGEIIDGQHRILGIEKSGMSNDFLLPVVFMFALTEEEKAYVFSTINSTQTKVSMSLIYDLFELSEGISPYKTCHEIARLLNSDVKSPFYRRLKMLGKKEDELASLSQGSFVKYLMPLISKNPDSDVLRLKKKQKLENDDNCPLRTFMIKGKDETIYKILFNMFNAIQEVFPNEWNKPNYYILTKTTGYGGIMKAFPHLFEKGVSEKTLKQTFFKDCFLKVKIYMEDHELDFTSSSFSSGEQGQRQLRDLIIEAIS